MLNKILTRSPKRNHLAQMGFMDFGETFQSVNECLTIGQVLTCLVEGRPTLVIKEKSKVRWELSSHSMFKPTLEASDRYNI